MAKKEEVGKTFINPAGHIRDRIEINPDPSIPREGIFLSLNGFPFQIKPGVPVDIPRPVRLMMDTLIKTETSQDDDGKQYVRNVPRFTYRVIKEGVNLDADGNVIKSAEEQPAEQAT
jgi:hypothetical protein